MTKRTHTFVLIPLLCVIITTTFIISPTRAYSDSATVQPEYEVASNPFRKIQKHLKKKAEKVDKWVEKVVRPFCILCDLKDFIDIFGSFPIDLIKTAALTAAEYGPEALDNYASIMIGAVIKSQNIPDIDSSDTRSAHKLRESVRKKMLESALGVNSTSCAPTDSSSTASIPQGLAINENPIIAADTAHITDVFLTDCGDKVFVQLKFDAPIKWEDKNNMPVSYVVVESYNDYSAFIYCPKCDISGTRDYKKVTYKYGGAYNSDQLTVVASDDTISFVISDSLIGYTKDHVLQLSVGIQSFDQTPTGYLTPKVIRSVNMKPVKLLRNGISPVDSTRSK